MKLTLKPNFVPSLGVDLCHVNRSSACRSSGAPVTENPGRNLAEPVTRVRLRNGAASLLSFRFPASFFVRVFRRCIDGGCRAVEIALWKKVWRSANVQWRCCGVKKASDRDDVVIMNRGGGAGAGLGSGSRPTAAAAAQKQKTLLQRVENDIGNILSTISVIL
ncbi:hypothetical protein EUGRSUZ_C04278 [Eucalyptus grandis]|uniref:Uncharacterized protein n=2 Tax=Eucalyptus grandis TaxID=71139 RepID=A0ACC3LKG6_EUCGR|nr:hypothetical protein EUGRSUZ_C04278 [Eucalyptus grandis]